MVPYDKEDGVEVSCANALRVRNPLTSRQVAKRHRVWRIAVSIVLLILRLIRSIDSILMAFDGGNTQHWESASSVRRKTVLAFLAATGCLSRLKILAYSQPGTPSEGWLVPKHQIGPAEAGWS